jgi:hypothetical protein
MNVAAKISTSLHAKLGRCPRCMRQSFFFMLGTWGLVVIVTLVAISPLLLTLTSVIAVGATGLWLSHLTAFALRAMRHVTTATDDVTCCASRLSACGSSGSCNTLYQNCVSNCNSQGASPSNWKCW